MIAPATWAEILKYGAGNLLRALASERGLIGVGAFTALQIVGSEKTEQTTISTSTVDLVTVAVSIPVDTPFIVVGKQRKTSGAATGANTGLKLNATQVRSVLEFTDGVDSPTTGMFMGVVMAGGGNYPGAGMFMNISDTADARTWRKFTGAIPTATITSVIILGSVGDAAVTLAVDDVYVLAPAAS